MLQLVFRPHKPSHDTLAIATTSAKSPLAQRERDTEIFYYVHAASLLHPMNNCIEPPASGNRLGILTPQGDPSSDEAEVRAVKRAIELITKSPSAARVAQVEMAREAGLTNLRCQGQDLTLNCTKAGSFVMLMIKNPSIPHSRAHNKSCSGSQTSSGKCTALSPQRELSKGMHAGHPMLVVGSPPFWP